MPLYEYECRDCHQVTELLRKMDEADEAIQCRHCDSMNTVRKHSVFNAGSSSGLHSNSNNPSCSQCCPGGQCGLD